MADTTRVQENKEQVAIVTATGYTGFGTLVREEWELLRMCRAAPSGAQLVVTISGRRPVKAAMTESVVRLQEVTIHE